MDRSERLAFWDSLPRPLVLPSILDCDFGRVGEEVRALEAAGARALHLDVIDGRFVPNFTFGAPVIASWRRRTELLFEAHLMVAEPSLHIEAVIGAGCDRIVIHIEAAPEPTAYLQAIRRAGCRAGLALNPGTPVTTIEPFLSEVDAVLVMSVSPGYGGQAFKQEVLEKVKFLRRIRPGLSIGIDGGIGRETARLAAEAGASELVAGSSILRGSQSYEASYATLSEAARVGAGVGSRS